MKYLCEFIMLCSICFSCTKSNDPSASTMDMNNPMQQPSDTTMSKITKAGTFISYAHNLKGSTVLHIDSIGKKILHFENFTMSAGPDVHVYISKSSNYTKNNIIEVTKLTEGFNSSNIDFNFVASNYTSDYKFVLVYCVQYNTLFGYAELK